MTYAAKIIADSIAYGVRLTTLEVTFPRFILAEINTHRMLSRNSASSRAIPVERRLQQVRENPFMPEAFGKNKPGMQADAALDEMSAGDARLEWQNAAADAVESAARLAKIGVHKQHANRLLEPFCWHTMVVTATEWDNFFALRCHQHAQPEMQITAKLMRDAMHASTPRELRPKEWHLPYVAVTDNTVDTDAKVVATQLDGTVTEGLVGWRQSTLEERIAISAARCAAVSYERQNVEKTIEQYVARHNDLRQSGHMSPFEHQARCARPLLTDASVYDVPFEMLFEFVPAEDGDAVLAGVLGCWQPRGYFCGNFRAPWLQYRKMLPNEAVFSEQQV
jgi:thymidylate synthase ThyX